MKTGEFYVNVTRRQLVELLEVNKKGNSVEYNVIEGNKDNKMKMFKCSYTRFQRLYIKSNKFINF